MRQYYDFTKARSIINEHRQRSDGTKLVSASLGMLEDWYWTAQEIWNFERPDDFDFPIDGQLGGINSSHWATPTLELEFEDACIKRLPCWTEEDRFASAPKESQHV